LLDSAPAGVGVTVTRFRRFQLFEIDHQPARRPRESSSEDIKKAIFPLPQ
jgi:hypothetical protein